MPLLLRKERVRTYVIFILLGIGIYTLLPFLLLTIYNHPAADDFSFAVRDRTLDYFTVMQQYYFNWTGRYFSTITLFRINPMIFDALGIYKLFAALLFLLFSSSVFFIVYTITGKAFGKKEAAALAALLVTLYLLQLPSPSEGFYFFSTYATYQFANVLVLVLLALLYTFFNSSVNILGIVDLSLSSKNSLTSIILRPFFFADCKKSEIW